MIIENGRERRTMAQILHAADRPDDPAPVATVLPTERAQAIVRNISATTLDELRQLRDRIDDLMRSMQAREDAVAALLTEYAHQAEDAIAVKKIVSESVDRLCQNFERSGARLGPTVTQ